MDRYIEFILNHYILSLGLVIVTYLLIQDLLDSVFIKFSWISPLQVVAKLNQEDVLIIDVREPTEFTQSHIDKAVNTPLSSLNERLAKLEAHKKTPVVIICQSGTRSASAGKILTKAGFEQVFAMTGGMQAWEEHYKLPIKVTSKSKAKA